MRLAHSILFNTLALLGCAASAQEAAGDSLASAFELCTVARDPGADVVSRTMSGTSTTLLVKLPAVLSGRDLTQVKAVDYAEPNSAHGWSAEYRTRSPLHILAS